MGPRGVAFTTSGGKEQLRLRGALGHRAFKTARTAGRRKCFSGSLVVCTYKHTSDLFVCFLFRAFFYFVLLFNDSVVTGLIL